MNQKLSYLLNVVLSIGLFAAVFKSGCNNKLPGQTIIIQTDSNEVYDELERAYFNQTEILTDSIEKLKQSLRTKKIAYIYKTEKVFKDSIITVQECCEMLPEANKIIESQDSVIRVQTDLISECDNRVNNLILQVRWNENRADNLAKTLEGINPRKKWFFCF